MELRHRGSFPAPASLLWPWPTRQMGSWQEAGSQQAQALLLQDSSPAFSSPVDGGAQRHGLLDQRTQRNPSKSRAVIMSPRGATRIIKAEWPACLSLCTGSATWLILTVLCVKGAVYPHLQRRPTSLVKGPCPKSHGPEGLEPELSDPLSFCSSFVSPHESLQSNWAAHPRNLSSPRSVGHRAPCPFVSS